MRILFYNWAHLDDSQGGGVTVYQRNLALKLLAHGGYDIYFLNSGLTYESKSDLHIKEIANTLSKEIHTYEIINSPVIAPVQQSILNIRYYLEDQSVLSLLKAWIKEVGEFDVIHFNNLEGLPLQVLLLKEVFPRTKFIYSLHNYFPLCSRVDLWQGRLHDCGHLCDKESFAECADCYFKLGYQAEKFRRMHGTQTEQFVRKWAEDFPDEDDVFLYKKFTEQTILTINRFMDVMLAVSNRVKNIFLAAGINEKKIFTSYIGTKVAEKQLGYNSADIYQSPFHVIYMGYMKESKGFNFFLSVLKAMEDNLAHDIKLTIAARYDERQQHEHLELLNQLRRKFADITVMNGYSFTELPQLLREQNLGIVPVLWEDNLPQVAIEQIAYGVPVLCSDRGGTSELCNDSRFVFQAGSIDDFLNKFDTIVHNRILLKEYWKHTIRLTTMDTHVRELERFWGLRSQ